ncbi:TPA: hypothetical protein U2C47_001103 [Streptococcus suis]|nr:hypothetical protein [Streptococcus suis]HEM6186085.1 hypothetical protein [Streptococcus suis]HEM6192587.1 hypothetical protein [Streptococcus suis]
MNLDDFSFELLFYLEDNFTSKYRPLIRQSTIDGNLSDFENVFRSLFSKSDGIAVAISSITNENESIFNSSELVKNKVQGLEKKYYQIFYNRIVYHKPNAINSDFINLTNDILRITRKSVVSYRSSSNLKEKMDLRNRN